ncbi:Gfo/Idh/MocA family oxidoreductase [Aureimonas sp. ME7]|uniref:Gfo/Idh/MocA family protein n=1 Tax=Aureimonas sp. ME7 TaxID=2744252 RepID=UPI0015F3B1E7|nr:Gfo/Idh/MocA family oxidoreductase [Aureimonas sp. ME7]
MAPARIGWGIVGTGVIAERFGGDLLHSASGRVAAVASRDADRARALVGHLAPGAFGGTLDEVLSHPSVDAVYIASPTAQHRTHALAAIAAGKPVLVEKPLAAGASEAREIAEAASSIGVLCMEAMWMRFTPGIQTAKRMLDDGWIGEIRQFEAQLGYPNAFDPGSRLFDPALGGGAHLDLGVYPLSLAFHLLGPPEDVAHTAIPAPNGVPMAGGLLLRYPNAVATLGFSFLAEGRNDAHLSGTGGRLRIQAPFLCPPSVSLRRSSSPSEGKPLMQPLPGKQGGRSKALRSFLSQWRERPVPTLYRGTGLQYQADHFAELMHAGATDSPVMPLAQSIAVLGILDRFSDRP